MLPSGAVFFILIAAVILAAGLAWAVAAMYERRMLALMSGSSAPEPTATAVATAVATTGEPALIAPPTSWGEGVNLAANRKATTRLMLYLGGLSLLIALTQSVLNLLFIYPNRQFSLNRLLLLSAIYAWPMALAWGLAQRWSWRRILGYIGVYMLAMLPLVMLRSTAAQSLSSVSVWLFSQVAVPMTIVLLIGASGRIRAVAPYLLPPALLLAGSSVLALQVATLSVQHPPPWIISLLHAIGAYPTLLVIALAPWLVLAWPVFKLSKWLAGAYRAKRFSDLTYLIATYWFLILFSSALPGMEEVRWLAFVEIVPWLWIPVFLVVLRGSLAPPPGPPTLLVLRVFQRDAQVELLFDQVIERWRLTGNTVLIAGTDLLSRTLDPDDLFVYLNPSASSPARRRLRNASQALTGYPIRTAATASTSATASTIPGNRPCIHWSRVPMSCSWTCADSARRTRAAATNLACWPRPVTCAGWSCCTTRRQPAPLLSLKLTQSQPPASTGCPLIAWITKWPAAYWQPCSKR